MPCPTYTEYVQKKSIFFLSSLVDKAVYLSACLLNTLSVFLVEVVYFCFAFPSFYLLVLVAMRLVKGDFGSSAAATSVQGGDGSAKVVKAVPYIISSSGYLPTYLNCFLQDPSEVAIFGLIIVCHPAHQHAAHSGIQAHHRHTKQDYQ